MTRSAKARVVLAIGATVLLGAPVAAGSSLPRVPTHTGTPSAGDFKSKPAMITYSGDGSGFLAGKHRSGSHFKSLGWSSWTTMNGKGSGYNWLDNCRPNCASGTFHSYPVTLKVYRPRRVGGYLIFTRMKVSYPSRTPPHVRAKTQVWKVKDRGGVFVWVFPPE